MGFLHDAYSLDELLARAADLLGEPVTPRTVRLYATKGLIDQPGRQGRNAVYKRHLPQLLLIRGLARRGLSLSAIAPPLPSAMTSFSTVGTTGAQLTTPHHRQPNKRCSRLPEHIKRSRLQRRRRHAIPCWVHCAPAALFPISKRRSIVGFASRKEAVRFRRWYRIVLLLEWNCTLRRPHPFHQLITAPGWLRAC